MQEADVDPVQATAGRLVLDALEQLAPQEVFLVEGLMPPLVEKAAGGEPIALETLRGSGRFGDADLICLALVALAVEVLASGGAVTPERVVAAARRTRSPEAARRSTEIAACLETVLARHRE